MHSWQTFPELVTVKPAQSSVVTNQRKFQPKKQKNNKREEKGRQHRMEKQTFKYPNTRRDETCGTISSFALLSF
jgi:hypothetical protein